MEFLLGLLVGFVGGWILLKVILLFRVKKILDSIEEQDMQEKPKEPTVKNLKFEKTGNRIYAYDTETNSFMAYGETKQQIVDSLNSRFPYISFKANSQNMKEVGLDEHTS
jgi:hypothetical protein